MKKSFVFLLIFISLSACKYADSKGIGLNNLEPHPVVMDYSKLFNDSQIELLSDKIIAYELQTTNEIAIITKDSIPKGEKIQVYATKLGEQLGVGKKDKHNGLLILISRTIDKFQLRRDMALKKHLRITSVK